MSHRECISVLIAAHQRDRLLRRTLTSVADSHDLDRIGKIVIVENDAVPHLESVVGTFHSTLPIEYVFHPRANKSAALNAGLEQCHDGLIVLLDADVTVGKDLWDQYLTAAAAYPEGWYFGGPLEVDYEREPESWLLPFMTASVSGWSLGSADCRVSRFSNFLGANWAAFKRDLLAIGGFDSRVGPGAPGGATGQESNAQSRLRRAGLRGRYVADARVWHYVSAAQTTPQSVLQRRERSGSELAKIVCVTGIRLFDRPLIEAALWAQKLKFHMRHKLSSEQQVFARRWHAAYRKGSLAGDD
jgi:GT2 family glycosyltransferase